MDSFTTGTTHTRGNGKKVLLRINRFGAKHSEGMYDPYCKKTYERSLKSFFRQMGWEDTSGSESGLDMPDMVSATQAMKMLGVKHHEFRKLQKRGDLILVGYKGRYAMFLRHNVEALMKR